MGTRITLNIDVKGRSDKQLKNIVGNLRNLEKGTAKATKGISNFGTVLGGVLGANIITAGFRTLTNSITGLAGSIFDTTAQIEQITQRFEILTGSAERAADIIRDLTEFTARTPFRLEGVTNAAAQLISFGFEVDEVVDRLKEIGDVAAGSGSNLGEVALIFGQVAAAGKLTGERLLQFQERAIPIGPAIARTMGIATEAVKEAVTAGKVDLEIFQEAFASLSQEGGLFFQATVKQSKTLSGVLSTLGDNFSLLGAKIGDNFLPIFKEAAVALIEFIQTNEALIVSLTVDPLLAFANATRQAFDTFKAAIPLIVETAKVLANLVVIYGTYRL